MNDIERLEDRCDALEKECRTLREVLAAVVKDCPLSHEPRRLTYQPTTCDWCDEIRLPDSEYVKKIDDETRKRTLLQREQARKKP